MKGLKEAEELSICSWYENALATNYNLHGKVLGIRPLSVGRYQKQKSITSCLACIGRSRWEPWSSHQAGNNLYLGPVIKA